jgi:hypothetical protein
MDSWRAGDRVLAYWDADGYWYPATIVSINKDGDIAIKYDDGDEEVTDADFLDELTVSVGDFVENKSADDDEYHEAEVLAMEANRIQVGYEDDSSVWTTIGNLRVPDFETWEVGDGVFAYWEEDGYFYPAEITAIDEAGIHLRYADGTEELSDPDYLETLDVMVGEGVECRADDGLYHEAQIVDLDDTRVQVEYDDETTAWTDLGHIRIAAEEEDEDEAEEA